MASLLVPTQRAYSCERLKMYLYVIITNKEKDDSIRKLPFGHHYSNNCFRQDSSIKVKISEQEYDDKQDIYKHQSISLYDTY